MGFNFRGLAFKQSLMILAAVTVIVGVIFGIMTSRMSSQLEQMTLDNGEQISQANVTYIDKLFNAGKLVGEDVGATLSKRQMTKAELDEFLMHSLTNARNLVPHIVAVVVAFEPGMGPETPKGEFMRLARFVDNENRLITGTNYQDKEWYTSTRDGHTSRWQEPFIGEFVDEPIAVYTVPIFHKDKKGNEVLAGVLAVDMSIEFLKETVADIQVSNSGYAMVLSARNYPVAYPKSLAEGKSEKDIVVKENINKKQVDFDREKKKDKGLFRGTVAGSEESAIYYMTMESNNWTFMVVWPI